MAAADIAPLRILSFAGPAILNNAAQPLADLEVLSMVAHRRGHLFGGGAARCWRQRRCRGSLAPPATDGTGGGCSVAAALLGGQRQIQRLFTRDAEVMALLQQNWVLLAAC